MITEYVPTDLTTIKRITTIKTPNDLEVEISNISETLKDLSKLTIKD